MEYNCLRRHIDSHSKGLGGKKNLDESFRKKQLDHLFGYRHQITMMNSIAIHAYLCQKIKLLQISILRFQIGKSVTDHPFYF